jgi:hypothetical protein
MAAKHKSKQKSKSNRQPFSGGRRQFLSGVSITMVGVGSLARPFAELAVRRGADHFRLIDLKRYKPASVENQCLPNEVGQLKVDAVGQRLEELGARVETFPVDVFRVPDGVVEPGGVVISSVDNWRGFIGANRLAMRMNARLLKLNVEPKLHCAAVRAYSLGAGASLCGEDQMDDRHYADQLHPRSCDAPTAGRRTASSPKLCKAAARLGLVALHRMVTGHEEDWNGWQWQYLQDTGRVLQSKLVPNSHCRCDHAIGWHNLSRVPGQPANLTLRGLFKRSRMPITGESRVRFCQRVALRARCGGCFHESDQLRWVNDVDATVALCDRCGEPVHAIPFWTYHEVTCEQLASVVNDPLAKWGVPSLAVIEVSNQSRRRAFVVPGDGGGISKGAST